MAPGNWALKDQALAINWIHSHISHFGGDPSRLTLIGQSSGAVYTHLHLLSEPGKWAKEKIFGAISLSGNAYNVWGLNTFERGVALSKTSARLAHCPTNKGTKAMLDCMRKADAKLLVANQLLTMGRTFPLPMVEPKVDGAFLKETPDEAYINGHVGRVPWISTVTSQEANTAVAGI